MQDKAIQPDPNDDALGLFAEASVLLSGDVGDPALQRHVESLATLTRSDLVLLYERTQKAGDFVLAGQYGLDRGDVAKFQRLGSADKHGGVVPCASSDDSGPMPCVPLTDDLLDLGIRACWAYPLWHDGDLLGHAFFGTRNWDEFHHDTFAVFAATTIQVAYALRQRKSQRAGPDDEKATWSEDGGATGIARRQQFIAVLAHELRNPIAPIRSGLDLIATGTLTEQVRRDTVRMMQRQLGQLVRLIDDLLDTVRLSTGKLQLKREEVVLRDVIAAAIESIRPALQAKHQALSLDDLQANVVVDVDPVRLAQAFVNILSANTRETPEEGVLDVSAQAGKTAVTVTFRDQGPGIDTADLANVFELFPKSAADKSDDGLGIGLGLVKGLVELNDGKVWARNRLDRQGAEYVVSLPFSASTIELSRPESPEDRKDWSSHRLLIVDDNHDAAETLGLLFELDGHTVRMAHDGPSAVARALEFQPEVIFMDIGLPGFSGVEASVRIRTQETAVRPYIIAVTGWGAESDRRATKNADIDLHLVKPVSHQELHDALSAGLASRRKNE